MRLKSLEIEGFKSFPEKTTLVFDRDVTSIVGPNGCGKSNVVDAIRWVMGEQSARQLRGKSMEDVIFAGARERGPSPSAAVTLTFATRGALLPEPYAGLDEIAIGRRLYRTGESEYLIARQPARLKDVRDLFLGTGVGVNAYSVIEQGSIGALVTAKPEDRRRIVEEAAGISKFQARKEAALRRMESTTHNLQRLRDVIAELERQKSSLERQARKAEKYRKIRDELKSLDLALAEKDKKAWRFREEEILSAMRDLEAEHVATVAAVASAEAACEAERLRFAELEREASDARQEAFEWDNALAVAASRLEARRQELIRADADAAERTEEGVRLECIRETLAAELESSGDALLTADLEREAGREELEGLEAGQHGLEDAAKEVFESLNAAREESRRAGLASAELEAKRSQIEERRGQIASRLTELRRAAEEAAREADQLRRLIDETAEGVCAARRTRRELDSRGEELAKELGGAEARLVAELAELAALKEGLLGRRSRLGSLEELERNFEGYHDGPRTLLAGRRTGEAQAVLGAVAEFVETDPGYEGAVAAVLGERAQCLVVTETAHSLDCAGLLKATDAGRGSFVALQPVGEKEPRQRVVAAAMKGLKGPLGGFVRWRDGFERLGDLVFGDTLLADTLADALDIWGNTRLPVVTFDGELIEADGVLTGGSMEKTSKALLEKKREIKELSALVEAMTARAEAKECECRDLEGRLKGLRTELDRMRGASHEEDVRLASQESEVTHARSRLGETDIRRRDLESRVRDAESALADSAAELHRLIPEIFSEKERCDAAETLIRERSADEASRREKITAGHAAITRAKVALAEAEQRRAFRAGEMERLIAGIVANRLEVLRSEEEGALLARRRVFLEDRIAFAERNIARLLTGKTARDEAWREGKAACDELQNALLRGELALKEDRRSAESLKERMNEAALELSEVRGRLTRLSEQLFERYRMTPDDLAGAEEIPDDGIESARARADDLREQMQRIGPADLEALDELKQVAERHAFLDRQRLDLEQSLSALERAIQKINLATRRRFTETFELINGRFSELFPKLFQGGEASLKLTDPENLLETGVDIVAQPPGKRLQSVTLLSGGEKALAAVSLLFAIFLIKPSPFCLLDEVDAPLDDANVDRYNEIVKEMSARTQFVVITHNKRTMRMADVLYGVTMERSGISQIVSVSLDGAIPA